MMGHTHALAGVTLSLAALPVLAGAGMHLGPAGFAAYTVAAAGGAMLPDLDHRHATIAQSLGPISRLLAVGVEAVSGGHRNGTHSLVGVAAFTGVAYAINQANTLYGWFMPARQAHLAGSITIGAWLAFLFAIATTALWLSPVDSTIVYSIICLAAGIGLVTMTATLPFPTTVLPWAVGIGALSHLITDGLTKEGVVPLWPLSKARFRILTMTTDSALERWLVAPALAAGSIWMLASQTGLTATIAGMVSRIA